MFKKFISREGSCPLKTKLPSRWLVIAGSAATFAHAFPTIGTPNALAQSALENWYVWGGNPLGGSVGSCVTLRGFADQASASAALLSVRDRPDLERHQDRLQSAQQALAREVARLEMRRDSESLKSALAGIGAAVGLATAAIGMTAVSPAWIGAALGSSIISGPAMFTMQIVLSANAQDRQRAGTAFLITHSADRVAFLASEVGTEMTKAVGRIFGVAMSLYGLYQALESRQESAAIESYRLVLQSELRSIDEELRELQSNSARYGQLKSQTLANMAQVLRQRAKAGESTGCRLTLTRVMEPVVGPVIRAP